MAKEDSQVFGGTQNYFGGTSRFRGTQVEKHCSTPSTYNKVENRCSKLPLNKDQRHNFGVPEGVVVHRFNFTLKYNIGFLNNSKKYNLKKNIIYF